LIGGAGNDRLDGGSNDDILIAGRTVYDALDSALGAIVQEWSSARTYAQRVNRLSTGADGLPVLATTTVLGDGDRDTLLDSPGLEWFFLEPNRDKLTNPTPGQQIDAEGLINPPPIAANVRSRRRAASKR
jgi:Ca2+-binding RTX toxin-like protein